MASATVFEPSSRRWPPQIKYIVGNEACERFSYYGMKSILAGYITGAVLNNSHGGLGKTPDESTQIIHLFTAANYFMPLIGAWLSDKFIGRYHTILWVSLFYCAGHGVLACSDMAGTVDAKLWCLYAGLALIAFGSGGIKPCVSAFMGDQFKPEQSHLLQKAYGAFYWAINLGSFFSFLVIPWVKDTRGYSWAFAVPGILMAIATFIFWLGTKHYVRVPTNRQLKHAGFFRVFWDACQATEKTPFLPMLNVITAVGLPLLAMILMVWLEFSNSGGIAMKVLGWLTLGIIGLWYLLVVSLSLTRKNQLPDAFWKKAANRHDAKSVAGLRSFLPIMFTFAFVPVFWSLFDQTSSTWVLQGNKMDPWQLALNFFGHSFSYTIGAEEMQSMNPLIVMLLVPVFTLLIYPYIGRFAAPLKRMAYGMFLAAASYLIVAALQTRIDHGEHLSVLWQTAPYLVLTAAEVLLSTTGLEFAFREAAPELKSSIMSFWLLTVAFGNLLVSAITKFFSTPGHGEDSISADRFLLYAGMTFVVAILFSIVAGSYQYRDSAAAAGK